MTILIDSSEQSDPKLPAFDMRVKCPAHLNVRPKAAYGLAGGGIGEYTYCRMCGKILTKTQDEG